MADIGLYTVTLSFRPKLVGAGSLTLALAVNAVTGAANGRAVGTTLEGTADPQPFEASVVGVIHAAGLGTIVKLGSVHGDAVVSLTPPAIGTFLVPVTASFAVDANWEGTGTFTYGSSSYDCDVSQLA
jgi:hypothetical protein